LRKSPWVWFQGLQLSAMVAVMVKRPVVLVVDDEQIVLEAAASVIEHANLYDVIAVTSFDCAAAYLADSGSVDVLITDYRLRAARSGLELCQIAVARNRAVAIVVISAEPSEDIEPRPRCSVFLRKPFGVTALLDAIEAAREKALGA